MENYEKVYLFESEDYPINTQLHAQFFPIILHSTMALIFLYYSSLYYQEFYDVIQVVIKCGILRLNLQYFK